MFSLASFSGDLLSIGTLLILPLDDGLAGDGRSPNSGRKVGKTIVKPPASPSESLEAPLSLECDFRCIGSRL